MTTSRDIARAAGVSQTTVSRVLQDHPNVKPETRERVLNVLREMRYVPNAMARAMVTKKTGTIGVVVEKITNPFYPELLEALHRELAAANRRVILWNSGEAGEPSAIEAIRQGVVDGVIFTTARAESSALREAVSRETPAVLVNRYIKEIECDWVTTDNVNGGRTVAEYLIGCGHKRIGLISGIPGVSTGGDREVAFRRALDDRGMKLDENLCRSGDFSHHSGYKAMLELLKLPEPPSAVFCVNDLTAFGALDAARALNVTVPDDIWVIGSDDIDMASWEAFDLTTVRQPIPEMARVAVDILLRRIADPARPLERYVFSGELIIRGSTAHLRPE
jgi:LacI family transcriptional regulator